MPPTPPKFYEPWEATVKRVQFDDPFPDGQVPEGADPDEVGRQRDKARKLSAKAGWQILGTDMTRKDTVKSLMGADCASDGRQIVALFRTPVTEREDIDAQDMAERAAACVNAMAGIDSPEEFTLWLADHLSGTTTEAPRMSWVTAVKSNARSLAPAKPG